MQEILIDKLTQHLILPLWKERNFDVIDKFFSPSADIITTFLAGKGPKTLRESIQDTFKAFPDFELNLEELVQQNNRITYKWSAKAKHLGTILNIPPTGKEMLFHGMVFGELEGETIMRYHSFSNIPQILYSYFDKGHEHSFPVHSTLLHHESYDIDISHILFSITKKTGACLTRREAEALSYWIKGYSIKETAKQLGGLSTKTIQVFRENIRKKLKVMSYRQLFHLLQSSGLISLFITV